MSHINVPRGSYSITNALRFVSTFDRAIESQQDIEVKADGLGVSLLTLRQRISDALLYLVNELPEGVTPDGCKFTKDEYTKLRALIKFRTYMEGNSIIIAFNKNRMVSPITRIAAPSSSEQPEWREKLIKFLESDSKLFYLDNIRLTHDDMVWARERLAETGMDFEVNNSLIKVIR